MTLNIKWLLILDLFLLLFVARLNAEEKRIYHPVTVAQLASGKVIHTHVKVTGIVKLVKTESDGDTHIRLSDGHVFIVAECIPELPCKRPKLGDTVTVEGIARYDAKHKWSECHPTEKLTIEK